MSKVPIEISELRKSADGDTVKALAEFLEERLEGLDVDMTGSEIVMNFEEDRQVSRSYLRTLLRKFLHKAELKEEFRVIAGRDNAFVIKERKMIREE
ncbi:MAG: 60S ribosomal protein L22 [Candidatus Bathyarchaeota archaeon]|nr:MAG: 60S ribosomal protein L22 [Candidatus Bathyarchaeota archaeon]